MDKLTGSTTTTCPVQNVQEDFKQLDTTEPLLVPETDKKNS